MQDIVREILFVIVIFITNTIQGITGFAGALLSMPPAILLIGINEARAVINLIALISSFIIAFQNLKWMNKKQLGKIVVFMLIGMVLGFKLFEVLPLQLLLSGYGVLIIIIALKGLFVKRELNIPRIFTGNLVLVAAGTIHGMFVSGGTLLVIYAVRKMKDKNEFRATIAPVWVILNGFMIFNHASKGYFTKDVMILLLIAIIPMYVGIRLGNVLYKRINQALFLKVTYVLLVVSGLLVLF